MEIKKVLSLAAGKTIELISQTNIHAHPNKKYYNYGDIEKITFRGKYGIMSEIYNIEKIYEIDVKKLSNLDDLVFCTSHKEQILDYINKREMSFKFEYKGIYKFYVLKSENILIHKPKLEKNIQNHCWIKEEDLLNGNEIILHENLVTKKKKVAYTGYWTFFCNPKKWEIDKFLATNIEKDTYQITAWQSKYFEKGQLGVIRVGKDTRTKKQLDGNTKLESGIYAIVEIISNPKIRNNKFDEFWSEVTEKENDKPIVEIRYIANLLNNPILLKNIKKYDNVSLNSYLIKGFQASSMPLEAKYFDLILSLTNSRKRILENIQIENISTLSEIEKLEEKYKNAVPEVKSILSKRIERGEISNKIKKYNNFECQICKALNLPSHSFKKKNGEYYVETHHIIPVSTLSKGKLGISNLMTVCPNHHRELHYGFVQILTNNKNFIEIQINDKKIKINKVSFNCS